MYMGTAKEKVHSITQQLASDQSVLGAKKVNVISQHYRTFKYKLLYFTYH